ncbi:MAG: class I SAM-dependent RNA methyltransferase [Bacteroidia bacterium]|nr:class I SAM-dependent RNA methyltransferase [Bacteroidia bacterium]
MTQFQPQFKLIAKTFFGLEQVLANELQALGAENIEPANRAVSFTGTKEIMYKTNLHARTALRILKIITEEGKAADQQELYDTVKKIPWEEIISFNDTIAVDSTTNNSNFNNTMFVSLKVKDAIVDRIREKMNKRPSVDTDKPDIRINVHVFRETCTISLDSSGSSLHLRGYRDSAVKAPLNEVLAAGLIKLSGWDGTQNFLNPMCGSGTLLIEAVMLAKNIPAGFFRKEFAFEKWKDFNTELWEQILEDAKQNIDELHCLIEGFDSARKSIEIAKDNIKSAGLQNDIKLSFTSFEKYEPNAPGCIAIINPPYGERMVEDEISELYKMMGTRMKHFYKGYDVWIITGSKEGMHNIGLKTSRRIQVYNGGLECRFIQYQIFDGKMKDKKTIESTNE